MYLGIDCGTQGTKALLLDHAGHAHGRGYAAHQLTERETGAREQDPAWWVDALGTAVRQAVGSSGAKVRAVSVSGQQHGLVVLDENCQIIRPAKLWNDTETSPQNEELVAMFGGRQAWLERFGIVPLTGYTVSKLLWLKQNEPANFARIHHILLPHDYLNFYLTGQLRAERGDASGTGFFNPRTGLWAREVLDAIDGGSGQLFAALPQLCTVDDPVGTLLPAVAEHLGLSPQAVVAAGGGDNMMGAIGTGNVREGVVTLSLGTSSTVYSYQTQASADTSGNVAPFCASSCGGWLPLVCTMNATNVVTQTLKLLGRTVSDIEAALSNTRPGADGIVFFPFLNGERTPDLPTARGSIVGLSASNWSADNLIRAAIEGVTFGVLNGLQLMQRGHPVERIVLIGGGARSAGWRQLIADATGATVEVPLEEEAGCLGAAIQAMYLEGVLAGKPTTFAALAERCIRSDESRAAQADPARSAAYQAALETYNRELTRLYL
jgi:xylulokinase